MDTKNMEHIQMDSFDIEKVYSTKLGFERIKRNLGLGNEDVLAWCKDKLRDSDAKCTKKGKNYYIEVDEYIFTINSSTLNIITAKKK